MTVEEVMFYRRATPFRPFVLHLKDGRQYLIREPEQIGRNPSMTWIGVALEDGETGDSFEGSLVSGVEVVTGPLPPLPAKQTMRSLT